MVAFKHSNGEVSQDELIARAKMVSRLLEAIEQIGAAAEQIKDGKYWEAYRSVSASELTCAEVAGDLHEIDLTLNNK